MAVVGGDLANSRFAMGLSAAGATMSLALAAAELGAGPAVAILHGLFGSGRNWVSIGRSLAAAHRVLLFDLRNHGASPWAEGMSYAEMAADVRAGLAARGLARAALLGHSLGGKVAMALALAEPQAVERLVVVDIAPVAYPPALLAYVRAMQDLDLSVVSAGTDLWRAGAVRGGRPLVLCTGRARARDPAAVPGGARGPHRRHRALAPCRGARRLPGAGRALSRRRRLSRGGGAPGRQVVQPFGGLSGGRGPPILLPPSEAGRMPPLRRCGGSAG